MTNFPGSAPSFAAKTPGQVIASAHINAIQDEVVAIGGGYVNGTAPLNSSNSTLAHISAGSSTITALTVTNSTINILTVVSVVPASINANSTALVIANIATATSASSGSASAVPSPPAGYIKISLNGTEFRMPYFNI